MYVCMYVCMYVTNLQKKLNDIGYEDVALVAVHLGNVVSAFVNFLNFVLN